ncbi:MAG TPA: hypothetical protein VGH28_14145 [Polyangiaceae bacterium]|jgi:hypothetical protein
MRARLVLIFLVSCGGTAATTPTQSAAAANAQVHTCGNGDTTHAYDLHDPDGDEALVPCSKSGARDYSGIVHIETIPEGVHITINATDDEVDMGALGSDVKNRDAVIVYPKGPGSKAIEVPLMKTKDGYTGDRIIPFEDLDKLTDEGTKLDVAIFDHDKSSGQQSEELHVSVSVSAGKSCEKAFEETPDTMEMGKAQEKDLSADQLGAPIGSGVVTSCGLPNDASSDICVTMKDGKALGATIAVTPTNKKVAACIDKAVRHLKYPMSHRPNRIHKKF